MKILKIGYDYFTTTKEEDATKLIDVLDAVICVEDRWVNGKKYWVKRQKPDLNIILAEGYMNEEEYNTMKAAEEAEKTAKETTESL